MTDLLAQANTKANREKFLNHLAQQAGRDRHQVQPFEPLNDLPDQVLANQAPQALLVTAKQNSEAVAAKVYLKTSDELASFLDEYLQTIQAKTLLLPGVGEAQWDAYHLADWADHPQGVTTTVWSPDPADRAQNAQAADQADLAVGFADYLIANTGTITVVTTPAQGRAFNYLPEHYLALVPQSGLVRSTRQAVEKYEAALADGFQTSAINFISGPSNSGDIEMELVVGVHGPVDCAYVIVTDR